MIFVAFISCSLSSTLPRQVFRKRDIGTRTSAHSPGGANRKACHRSCAAPWHACRVSAHARARTQQHPRAPAAKSSCPSAAWRCTCARRPEQSTASDAREQRHAGSRRATTHPHAELERVKRLEVNLLLALGAPSTAACEARTGGVTRAAAHAPPCACRRSRCAAARAGRPRLQQPRICRWTGRPAAPRDGLRRSGVREHTGSGRGRRVGGVRRAPCGASCSDAVDRPPYSLSANVCGGERAAASGLHVVAVAAAAAPATAPRPTASRSGTACAPAAAARLALCRRRGGISNSSVLTCSVRGAAHVRDTRSRSMRQGCRRTLLHVVLGASHDAAPHRSALEERRAHSRGRRERPAPRAPPQRRHMRGVREADPAGSSTKQAWKGGRKLQSRTSLAGSACCVTAALCVLRGGACVQQQGEQRGADARRRARAGRPNGGPRVLCRNRLCAAAYTLTPSR